MAEMYLTPKERQALKARAHALRPVVLIGAAGLTAAVVKEVDRALIAHELVKVRVPGDDRAAREALFASLAETLSAARVQAIGKLLVLFRPSPDEQSKTDREKAPRAPSPRRPAPLAQTRAKPKKAARSKPERRDVEQLRRGSAPRRDPGAAHRAAGRRNAAKRRG